MKKVEAKKDGNGNIIITEDSFEMLLACLDNQKFVGEDPQNGDSLSVGEEKYYKTQADIQKVIDDYNRECRKILHQKYIFETTNGEYFLCKKYEYQEEISKWTTEDVYRVSELFRDTILMREIDSNSKLKDNGMARSKEKPSNWKEIESKPEPWYIERPLRFDYDYLTISENGKNNRPWKKEEVETIKKMFNNKD